MRTGSSSIPERLLGAIRGMLPEYLANEADRSKNDGHAAVCIIDESGRCIGEMFGRDRAKLRKVYQIATAKALQTWLTGIETGEYERRVYNKELDYHRFGIPKPELIGYEGGVPVEVDGARLAVGFSGFSGESDREIILRAVRRFLEQAD